MLGIFLLGALTRRATGLGALFGALLALATLGLVIGLTSIAWTWYVAIGTVVTFVGGLLASLLAGLLWARLGPSATFIAGAVFTILGLAFLLSTRPRP